MENTQIMTLGEFRKWTKDLSDDIELAFCCGKITPIRSIDNLGHDCIVFSEGNYDEKPIYGCVRVATFCNKKI